MALSPLRPVEERAVEVQPVPEPLLTYAFDFETGEFTGAHIDKIAALRQFIRKALVTPRFRHLIYDNEYGSDLDELIGADVTMEFLQTEIPRLITEALIFNPNIQDVYDFSIEKDGDQLFVSFFVATADGAILSEGVTL